MYTASDITDIGGLEVSKWQTCPYIIHPPVSPRYHIGFGETVYVSGSSKIHDIHRIVCQLKWVWLTPTG